MQRKANPAALKKVTGLAFLRHFVWCIPKSEGDLPRGTLQLREEHGFDAPVGDALNVVKRADRPGHVAGIVIDWYSDAPVADLTFLVIHGVAVLADECKLFKELFRGGNRILRQPFKPLFGNNLLNLAV